MSKLHLWGVRACKKDGVHYYSSNSYENVLAHTMEEAMEKVKAKHPKAKFWSITHKGEVNIE